MMNSQICKEDLFQEKLNREFSNLGVEASFEREGSWITVTLVTPYPPEYPILIVRARGYNEAFRKAKAAEQEIYRNSLAFR